MNYAIETSHIRKEYGDKVAVKDLTLQVRAGEVFGFLGPNGAGKTTSIKMLLGLAAPTSGEGRLLGAPLSDYRARAKAGFLPEHFRFHDWLTAGEFLQVHGELYGMGRTYLQSRSEMLLEKVGLTPYRGRQLRTFSKGMLQRIGLAQALLNEPDLVFLDEPTSGLDPVGRRLVRDIIHELRQAGTTVFLNSHLLSEVEITCDRVAFIKNGEVLQTRELKDLLGGETRLSIHATGLSPEARAGLEHFGRDLAADGRVFGLTVQSEAVMPELVRYLVAQGADVYAVTPTHLSLEELFIQIVGTDGGL